MRRERGFRLLALALGLAGVDACIPAVVDVDSFALGNAYELSGMINPQAIAWLPMML